MDSRENTVRISIDPGSQEKHKTTLQRVKSKLAEADNKPVDSMAGHEDFLNLLNGIQSPVVLVDPSGQILDVNEAATIDLYYTRDEFRCLAISHILGGLEESVMHEILANCVEGSGISLEGECLRKDGVTYPCHTAVSQLTLTTGECLCFVIRA